MPTNAIKKQLHLYFGSNGTLLDKQGDLSANAQDDETFVINAYIEDGVVDNQTTLINFTPQDTMAYTSDWFAMFYRELVSYVVPTESEPRVFAKFSITVPSIILLVKSGKEQFTQRITIIQRYGNTHLGNFETLAQLNVDFPPTQALDENNDVAFVYSNEQGQTNQVGFYQVEYIEGNHVWVKKETILYNLSTKQFNFLGLTVNVGFSNPRGVPTVAQSTIYQLMQELNSQAVRLQIVEDDLEIVQNDIVNLQEQIDEIVDGTTDIAFDNAGTDLNSTFVEEAIKEVNTKSNANAQNIVDMKNGTTIVKKAEQDKNGNDIVNTYETKVIVSGIDSRVTNLENANMVKSVSYEPMTHIITFTFYDNTTQSLDLPLESAIIGASYDNVTKDITFTLQSGATLVVPLDDLVSGLASETWVNTYFIPKTSIVDNLTTNDATKVLSAKQGKTLQDTKESLSNKATNFSVVDDTKYPTTKAVSERLLNLPIQELGNKTLKQYFEDENLLSKTWVNRPNTTHSVVDGEIVVTATNTDTTIGVQQALSFSGNNYYSITIKSESTNSIFMPSATNQILLPTVNTFYTRSGIITTSDTTFRIYQSLSSGQKFTFKDIIFRPISIDKNIVDYWFGVYTKLKTSETNAIFSMFAPKQQEAWITPTLTGATSTYIRYRKDTLGTVIVEGNITVTTAGTNLTLPVGYRPLFAYTVGNLTFNTDGTVVSSATGTQTLSVRYTGA